MTISLFTIVCFAGAVASLLLAHILRTIRWRLILRQAGISVDNLPALASLSIGYLVNTLVPFRIGELVRGAILAYATKANAVSVLVTIVFERTVDLFCVAAIAGLFLASQLDVSVSMASVVGGLLVIALALLIRASRAIKRLIWIFASIFNDGLRTALLHFVELFTGLFAERALLRGGRFWLLTAAMWAVYLVSLELFALAVGRGFAEQFSAVYGAPLAGRLSLGGADQDWLLITYLTLPVLAAIGFASASGFHALARIRSTLRWAARMENFATPSRDVRPDNFRSDDHYGAYLDRRYRGESGPLVAFEERGIGTGLLHRVFHGGSGAVTALIEIDGQLRVRKFASGGLGEKLAVQRRWIADHAGALPVVEVIGHSSTATDEFYDMRYLGGTRDLYEAVHTEPLPASSAVLSDIIERMDGFHRDHCGDDATDTEVASYVAAKATANLGQVEAALPELFERETITVNGEPFAMSRLDVFRSPQWLVGRLTHRTQSEVHGDLTLENIMVLPAGGAEGWFLIDPNPVNGFESPLIDFAKLLQSLHLGYEAVHREPRAAFDQGRLSVSLHRSSQYDALFAHVCRTLEERFGPDVLRQIFLHEMINYLRLLPYQLKRSNTATTAFVACLCMLVQDFDRRYPGALPG